MSRRNVLLLCLRRATACPRRTGSNRPAAQLFPEVLEDRCLPSNLPPARGARSFRPARASVAAADQVFAIRGAEQSLPPFWDDPALAG
jgi:hypothetical protein